MFFVFVQLSPDFEVLIPSSLSPVYSVISSLFDALNSAF